MAVGRSPKQKVSLYSQAVVGTGGEVGGGESTSEGNFRSVGKEVERSPFKPSYKFSPIQKYAKPKIQKSKNLTFCQGRLVLGDYTLRCLLSVEV
jgi:hypothetical protein